MYNNELIVSYPDAVTKLHQKLASDRVDIYCKLTGIAESMNDRIDYMSVDELYELKKCLGTIEGLLAQVDRRVKTGEKRIKNASVREEHE